MSKTIKFIDLCSGIGAGRLGLEMAGMKCVAHSEIDDCANNTYVRFFNDNNNLGDLTKIEPEKLPDIDLLIAGFPCQTFSIVGQRKGFADIRGQIIYHIANILKVKKVPYFVLENVKGLVNHDGGRTLQTILDLLDSVGYVVNFRVLNSSYFGIPQIRERVYFVGIRKDLYTKPYFFPSPQARQSTDIKKYLLSENKNELDVNDTTFQRYLNNKYNVGRIDINEILATDFNVLDTRQSDLRVYKNICPTLRTGRHGLLYTRDKKLIRLSGAESLLIQGFPKDFIERVAEIPESKILAQTGNAMTVNVISAIGKTIMEYINGGDSDD